MMNKYLNIIHFKVKALLILLTLLCLTTNTFGQFDRDWKVYLIPFSHTDVGYTATVPVVIELQKNYLDSVVAFIKKSRANSDGEKFKWTIEVSWIVDSYLKSRSSDAVDTLIKFLKTGDIELGGMYLGLQTDLCSPEELVRSLYYSKLLAANNGFSVNTVLIDDTPGFTWSLAQLLNKAVIPYFATALNSFLCNFFTTTNIPYLFYWKSQQGKRTLVWRNIDKNWAYLEGGITQQVFADYSQMKPKITQLLQKLQGEGYPYDAVFINCSTGDNGAPNYKIVENAIQWNKENSQAKIKISTAAGFFKYVENKYYAQIPEYYGDAPNWWTWLFAPSATAGYSVSRKTQALLPAAEIFGSIADLNILCNYNVKDYSDAYQNNLMFEDHNLGTVNSVGDAGFWTDKMGWINSAYETAKTKSAQAAKLISDNIKTNGYTQLIIHNSLAWKRNETVIFPTAELKTIGVNNFKLIDNETKTEILPQFLADTQYSFYAENVPSVGYKTYSIIPLSAPVPTIASPNTLHLENGFYSIDLNSSSGDVKSLYDKNAKKELTKQDGVFNRYLMNSTLFPSGMQIVSSDSGIFLQRIKLRGLASGSKFYETEILLYNSEKRIDFNNKYDRLATTATESIDFKFGFNLSAPKLRYEIPFGSVRIYEDELSGFRAGHYAAQKWINVNSATDNVDVVLGLSNGNILAQPSGSFDGVLRMMVSYNSPSTNYRAGIGVLDMNFSLTSRQGSYDDPEAGKFSHKFTTPLVASYSNAGQVGILPGSRYSFMSSDNEKISVSTIKKSESGRGYIIRLFNPSNVEVSTNLNFANPIQYSYETSLIEEDVRILPYNYDKINLTFTPYEVKTIRVKFNSFENVNESLSPDNYSLNQNYPNPFNPSTKISFSIPQRMNVAVKVYNVLGQMIAELTNKEYSSGKHELMFNASKFASGLYFYSLEAGGYFQIKKMLQIK